MVKNIVLVTNEINPYRKSFYDLLNQYCKLRGINFTVLLMTKVEHGYNWNYESLQADYAILMKGLHFSFPVNNHLNVVVLKYLRNLKPDVVIMAGSYLFFTNWLVVASRYWLHFPIYFWSETHFYGKSNYGSFKLKIRDIIRRILYTKFDGFLYSGKLSKDLIEHYALKNAKYHFVPNLIDANTYYEKSQKFISERDSLRNKWQIPLDNIVLITPARLVWVKGIHTFLDLLKNVSCSRDVTMLIPGTGPYKREIENKIEETGLDVRLLGFQPQDNIIEFYSLSDFFVLPSLSDANPLTCIEALWCGLPLLVSVHVGNYPEAVQEGKNGYVFDYSNPQDAIAKIQTLLNSSSNWRKEARNVSLKIAKTYYSSDNVAKSFIDNLIKEIE